MTDHVRIEAEHPHDPARDVLVVDQWLSYEVESDMFTPADGFTLRIAPTKFYQEFFRDTGHNVRIYYRDNLIMTGIIEAAPVNVGDHGPQIELTGRDYASLLTDDAAPLLDLSNQSLEMILVKLIEAHSTDIKGVITDNDSNRFGLVGKHADYSKVRAIREREKAKKGRRTKAESDAVKAELQTAARLAARTAKRTSRKLYVPYTLEKSFKAQTTLGESRWSVIERLSKFVGMSAWMTADGYLCMARPDYTQPPIGQLYTRTNARGDIADSNCLMTLAPDIGGRASDYQCLGQGQINATSSGKDLAALKSTAQDPSRAFWWGPGVRRRQRIKTIPVQNTGSAAQLTRFARTKMEEAAIKAYNCVATVEGHEVYPGGPLWAVDTMTDVIFEPKGIAAPHCIRRRQFTYDANDGPATDLTPMPSDIWLAVDHEKLSDAEYFNAMDKLFRRYAL